MLTLHEKRLVSFEGLKGQFMYFMYLLLYVFLIFV